MLPANRLIWKASANLRLLPLPATLRPPQWPKSGSVKSAESPYLQSMDPQLVDTFGPRFLVNDVRELELLTDLLARSKDHLNVVFAVASYMERSSSESTDFRPLLRNRLDHSIEQLRSRAIPS